jgi:SAM-dependent methyltransferase
LIAITPHYRGLDVSRDMIAYCRSHYPAAQFIVGDLKDVERLGVRPASVDVIIAIANVLDAVSHESRLATLAAIRRVLVPGGLLVFSSHNRRWLHTGEAPAFEHEGRLVGRVRRYATAWLNHHRLRKFEIATPEYALVNDSGLDYALLHYHIAREAQERQLSALGYDLVATFDENGAALAPGADDRGFSSLCYVARS